MYAHNNYDCEWLCCIITIMSCTARMKVRTFWNHVIQSTYISTMQGNIGCRRLCFLIATWICESIFYAKCMGYFSKEFSTYCQSFWMLPDLAFSVVSCSINFKQDKLLCFLSIVHISLRQMRGRIVGLCSRISSINYM